MNDIVDLERRLTSALERIGHGIDALKNADSSGTEGAAEAQTALESALAEEKTANAQLEERLRSVKEVQEREVRGLSEEIAALKEQLGASETALAHVKAVNGKLRGKNAALREANSKHLGDAHLINQAMLEELEALRATREADAVEVDAILAELKTVVEGEAHA